MLYPAILLPRQTYPVLENRDIRDNTLVRETMIDIYPFLEKAGYEPDDILLMNAGLLGVHAECECSRQPHRLHLVYLSSGMAHNRLQ